MSIHDLRWRYAPGRAVAKFPTIPDSDMPAQMFSVWSPGTEIATATLDYMGAKHLITKLTMEESYTDESGRATDNWAEFTSVSDLGGWPPGHRPNITIRELEGVDPRQLRSMRLVSCRLKRQSIVVKDGPEMVEEPEWLYVIGCDSVQKYKDEVADVSG